MITTEVRAGRSSLPPGAPAAFFSYSREDSDFALRLAEDLKNAGANVWLDQLDIAPGERWDRAVEAALSNCPRMLVILSPASVKSTNVMDEVSFALEEGKAVIPILYRDCAIPFRLRRVQHVNFRQDYARGLKNLLSTLAPAPSEGQLGRKEETPAIVNAQAEEHFRRGSDAARRGDMEETIKEFRKALSLSPQHLTARLLLGFVLIGKQDFPKAIEEFREVVRRQPDSAHGHLGLALSFVALHGPGEDARAEMRRAYELDPQDARVREAYEGFVKGDEGFLKGGADLQPKADAKAEKEEAQKHFERGMVAREKEHTDEAIAEFQLAVRLQPDFAEARYMLGVVLILKDDFDGASAQFHEMVRLAPGSAEGHLGLAMASRGKGDEQQIWHEIRRAYELDPSDPTICQFYEAVAMELLQKGRATEAIAEFREMIRINPGSAHAHLGLGVSLLKTDKESGLQEIRRAYELDSNDEHVRGAYEALIHPQ